MNISFSEILVVLVIALLVIKPDQLPGAALKLGKGAKMLQNLLGNLKKQFNDFIKNDPL